MRRGTIRSLALSFICNDNNVHSFNSPSQTYSGWLHQTFLRCSNRKVRSFRRGNFVNFLVMSSFCSPLGFFEKKFSILEENPSIFFWQKRKHFLPEEKIYFTNWPKTGLYCYCFVIECFHLKRAKYWLNFALVFTHSIKNSVKPVLTDSRVISCTTKLNQTMVLKV